MHGIVIVRFESALVFVIPVVIIGITELQPHTHSGHPKTYELEQRWRWIIRLNQPFLEPLTMPCKYPVYLLFFLLRHRLKRREKTTFDDVEAQNIAD